MSDMISLQNLIGSVHGLKQSMEATRLYILSRPDSSKSDSRNLSEYDSRFSELMNNYSEFAESFNVELDEFQQLLSRQITKQQLEQKREKEELLEKLEIMSNNDNYNGSNHLEIDYNSTEIDYSPATSINNEPPPKQEDAAYSDPVQIVKKTVIKTAKKKKKNPKQNIRKNATPNIREKKVSPKKNEKKEEFKNEENTNTINTSYIPYKYSGNDWHFNGVEMSSTMIFIGGLPNHIKVAAIQFFVMKKAKVTMRQIEETQLKQGGRGKYALVRFRCDVSMDRIVKFMDDVNTQNTKMAEEKRKNEYMIPNKNDAKNKKQNKNNNKNKKTSWQTRVFLKFNNKFKYYENEEAMFCDPSARNEVFIRNFDILNKECHKELSEKLLEYGELSKDIEIYVDSFGDPYCIARFKWIEDAVWCCNDAISFNGRTLEMRYSKF